MTGNVTVRKHTRRRTGRSAEVAKLLGIPGKVALDEYKRRRASQSRWYLDGYEEGREAAIVNLAEPGGEDELLEALEKDRLGEIAGQVREHQVQMAGDISYDVGRPGGPTEAQFEKFEEGFYAGFEAEVRRATRSGGE